MKINKTIAPLVFLAVVVAFVTGTMLSTPLSTTVIGDSLLYKGKICACKNSPGECYEGTPEAECSFNTITNGRDAFINYMFNSSAGGNFTYLALTNSSADHPTLGDTNFSVELTGGLARAEAAFYQWSPGNISLTYTWTADAEFISVNTTGIYNNSNTGLAEYFAGGTFTSVNLESGDTLTINYSLWINPS